MHGVRRVANAIVGHRDSHGRHRRIADVDPRRIDHLDLSEMVDVVVARLVLAGQQLGPVAAGEDDAAVAQAVEVAGDDR